MIRTFTLLLLTGACCAQQAPAPTALDLVKQGEKLNSEGKQDEALGLHRKAMEMSPNLYEAHLESGIALDLKGNYAEAREHLTKAIELAPAAAKTQALRTMAFSHAFEGNASAAAKFEQQVFDARISAHDFTGAAETANELARIYLESGDTANALKWYQSGFETAQRKPDLSDADKSLWSTSVSRAQNASAAAPDPRLQKSYRFQQGGWTYVHLEGSPADIGFQHGYLLAPEIADALEAIKLFDTHQTQRDWDFFRKTAREVLWPHIDAEYQQELQGIADGVKAHGRDLDVFDIVALNAFEEVPDYYVPWLNKREKSAKAPKLAAPGNCSAFIATGSYTKDHQIVIAHNNWTSYLAGERWTIIFDILPQHGQRILMDGFPGVITSDDDFGVNAAGIMITETTITQFEGWDPNGKPEFMRSRKALQYAQSIEDYVRIIKEGNNGGYANDWLIGDRKTGEIAYLELGLKNTPLWRTKNGYFVSSNFPRDPKLIREETSGFDPNDRSSSMNARHVRAEELMKQEKGKIDVEMAQRFLSDHMDTFDRTSSGAEKEQPNERSLCGHVDASARGVKEWNWDAYNPGGAVQGKATDSKMAANMSFVARAGHPCGADFLAADFLERHPEFSWQKPLLRDMKAGPWTTFQAGQTK